MRAIASGEPGQHADWPTRVIAAHETLGEALVPPTTEASIVLTACTEAGVGVRLMCVRPLLSLEHTSTTPPLPSCAMALTFRPHSSFTSMASALAALAAPSRLEPMCLPIAVVLCASVQL